jgi:diguanylate cyclase (GGDEF)-like protein
MNASTLFAANAAILAVMATAFYAAWRNQPEARYWPYWLASNIVIIAALLTFMALPGEQTGLANAVPKTLLAVGFGLRWQAARSFTGARLIWWPLWFPTLLLLPLFLAHTVFGFNVPYTGFNLVLGALTLATAYEFQRYDGGGQASRRGLMAAYLVISVSFFVRAAQGVWEGPAMVSYLPQDLLLQFHLMAAILHTTASGAFALSIAYERMALDQRELARLDPLTGAYNRRAFEAEFERYVGACPGEAFAMIVFDIDHFKRINDAHGHAAGDEALRACARICRQALREGDFLARMGGEEFVALLPDTNVHEAGVIAERVRRELAEAEIAVEQARIRITLSAGVCHALTGAQSFDTLMRRADASLYSAKGAGRNRIEQSAA